MKPLRRRTRRARTSFTAPEATTETRRPQPPRSKLLQLQQQHGNRTMQRMARSGILQAKLTMGKPGDRYEREADAVADKIVGMAEPKVSRKEGEEEEVQKQPLAGHITPLLQKAEPEQEEEAVQKKEEDEVVQAKEQGQTSPDISSSVVSGISSLKGGGQPLPQETRNFFEPRFGVDFKNVRVHSDSKSANLSNHINARAFTFGEDIVFGARQYNPVTTEGKHLLAHELTHVIQQANGKKSLQKKGKVLRSARFKGNKILTKCLNDEMYLKWPSSGDAVKLVQQALIDWGHPLPKYGADGKFGKETYSAVKRFQRSMEFTGKDIDGIIGPKTMQAMDTYIGSTPPKWIDYFQGGIKKLESSGVGFGFKSGSKKWKLEKFGPFASFKLISGTPSEGMEEMFRTLKNWRFDCALFPEVARIYADWKSMGDATFNRKFSGLRIIQHFSPGTKRVTYALHVVGKKKLDKAWNNSPVGSKVAWTNKSSAADGTAYKNENAIKVKKEKYWRNDLYYAHPLGNNLNEFGKNGVKYKLAAMAHDFPKTGTDSARKDYVNKNIYRNELHIFYY